MFNGRTLCIATMHGKEKVIAPLLEKHLQVSCIVTEYLNTDELGTFTGEIERIHSPLEAAKLKIKMALQRTGCDLAVASEGSFGPHPSVYFVPADEEILVLYDSKNDCEVVAYECSTNTNYSAAEVSSYNELLAFATRVKFPSHALILRNHEGTELIKGITDAALLKQAFTTFFNMGLPVHAETDMRAMYNPTRLSVIGDCTMKLVERTLSVCPVCRFPGFVVHDAVNGLPCSLCRAPTRSKLEHIYRCRKCGYEEHKLFPTGKSFEDPMYCDHCNP